MKARILNSDEHHLWTDFIKNHPLASVHQHPFWGEFQAKIPSRGKYWIVVLEDSRKIIGGSLIIRQKLPKGLSWLYAARGPLLQYDDPKINDHISQLITALKPLAKSQNSIFLRIDPPLLQSSPVPALKSFKTVQHGFQPNHTLIVDIDQPEEDILAQMKPKGRYNIKVATKKGVKIIKADPKSQKFTEQITRFHQIFQETTTRDGFHGHPMEFYKNMVETLHDANLGALYLAEYDGAIISGLIATFFKDTAIYYYGASSNEHRNVMAPYLLQWEAIKEAKTRNLKYYDFLGIAPDNHPKDPWHGITQFKKKFGGQQIDYQLPREYSFKPLMYILYSLYKKIKKL